MDTYALQPVVVVGAAQLVQREVELAGSPDPLELLCRVARQAAEDAGAGEALLRSLDTICLVDAMGWHPSNAPGLLAAALGAGAAKPVSAATGGETGLSLLNAAAKRIARGQSRAAFVGSVHLLKTLYAAKRAQTRLTWPKGGGAAPELWSPHRAGESEFERRHGLEQPTQLYPLVENALRARRRRGLQAHRAALGELFSPMTRVAAHNPYAWFPQERSAQELCTVSARNRMIAYPYTKYLNAVMETDQAAGVLLMSLDAARAAGIARERCMFWLGGAYAEERAWYVSERADLSRSLALEACAKQLLERTAVSTSEIAFIDFYSCFPVAVELACEAYGVAEDDPRGLTVTGGLPYAGGPGNGYTLHAVAAMLERLRAQSDSMGLCTGNGWYLTKHAATLFGTRAPHPQLLAASLEPGIRCAGEEPLVPTRNARERGRIEAYTLTYDREGAPERCIVVGRLESGPRFVANAAGGRALLETLAARELCGLEGIAQVDDGLGSFAFD